MSEFKKLKSGVYIAEGNFEKKIKYFYLGIHIMDDGAEGVMAYINPDRYPLVEQTLMGATLQDRDAIIKTCREVRKQRGIKCRVLKFSNVEVIEEFI